MEKEFENTLIKFAATIRNKCLKMALNSGRNGSHLGGGLSLVEVFAALYSGAAKTDPVNSTSEERDRIIVSKGHCVLSYYSALNEIGFISNEDLSLFETNGAVLHGHATRDLSRGIEFSGGSLGMGLSFAIGVALSLKIAGKKNRVFAIVGDGECNEGIVWEAFMSASHFNLDNLTVIIDHNKLQYDGDVKTIMNMGSLASKLQVFGFDVCEIDGHNVAKVYDELIKTGNTKPRAIIADTIKGKGVSFMENKKEWHHSVLTQEQYDIAISEQPFQQ